MNDDVERWIREQESLPEHLQRWFIFERPDRIWIARIFIHIGLSQLGKKICGMRYENDAERAERLRKYWDENDDTSDSVGDDAPS